MQKKAFPVSRKRLLMSLVWFLFYIIHSQLTYSCLFLLGKHNNNNSTS